jgi:hypothetical protein
MTEVSFFGDISIFVVLNKSAFIKHVGMRSLPQQTGDIAV